MKKLALIMCILFVVSFFAACDSNEKPLPDGQEESLSTDDELYEVMTGAAQEGDYKAAVSYYNAGGAGADKSDTRDWYLYSLAMDEYNEYNCTGYPLDILSGKVSPDFAPARAEIEKLRALCEAFNGIYTGGGKYIYISDGKIGTSVDTQITDVIYCSDEIAVKDGAFFWTMRNEDGTHSELYTIRTENNQLIVTATEDNAQDVFSGIYNIHTAEMPMLCY